ncbi:MAG: DUF4870 domain-containing protein [Acidobacteria bacterium]|nr:DUF4870 domain-containing protein [Acidobacteriota bacterium]
MQNQKSAIGLDANIAALIGYPVGILALILIFIEKENRFVRFHALQSVLWSVGVVVGWIVIMIVGAIIGGILSSISSTLGLVAWGIFALVYLGLFFALFGGIVYGAIKAYQGQMTKLPIVGSFAEKWA